jgi:hypothetical protein
MEEIEAPVEVSAYSLLDAGLTLTLFLPRSLWPPQKLPSAEELLDKKLAEGPKELEESPLVKFLRERRATRALQRTKGVRYCSLHTICSASVIHI